MLPSRPLSTAPNREASEEATREAMERSTSISETDSSRLSPELEAAESLTNFGNQGIS
jgi:hypothetical protein